MFKNYFKIAVRNLFKYKFYSLINIFGLAIGIAACILILLFIKHEWSYDNFHKNADNIYRVALLEKYPNDQTFFNTVTPLPLGQKLKEDFPEIKQAIRVSVYENIVKYKESSFEERIHLVDDRFFKVFDFHLIYGNTANVLKDINSVVITKTAANKYFGYENATGEILSIKIGESYKDFQVTGVAEDVPSNSSIKFNIAIPFLNGKDIYSPRAFTAWFNVVCETYVLTREGISSALLESKVPGFVKNILGEDYKEGEYNLLFQPLKDIHLNTEFPEGIESISNPVYSYILLLIAFLVLLIAAINFITLSIGRSASRAAEVGIRKVIGADRNSLIKQFWGESLLIVLISMFAAVVISEIMLPYFNILTGKALTMVYDIYTVTGLITMALFTGLAAGIYPALVLSAFKPVEVLKGKIKIKSRTKLRQSLVGFQFVLSLILISSTLIISQQLRYMQNKNLGYKKEQVVVIPSPLRPMETIKITELFRNELSSMRTINNVSSSVTPMNSPWNFIGFGDLRGLYQEFVVNIVDYDYINTLNIQLLEGRNFSKEFPADITNSIIVNESFAKTFKITDLSSAKMPGRFPLKVIGIVKDFNYESLHSAIKPAGLVISPDTLLRYANDFSSRMDPKFYIRISTADIFQSVKDIEKAWSKIMPEIPFEYRFLDDELNRKYESEQRLSTIVITSTIFAIVITCLGLLGLTILVTIQRTKEIGIRKVLGASVSSVIGLLSKEFFFLIILANILSLPLAYFAMQKWLEEFAYRIDISAFTFIISGLIILSISMSAIIILVYKAALENPIKSLKYE